MSADNLVSYELLDWLETNLSNSHFNVVNDYLKNIDIESLYSTDILLVLTITFYAKDKLINRNEFLEKAELILIKRLGEDRAEKLLFYRR